MTKEQPKSWHLFVAVTLLLKFAFRKRAFRVSSRTPAKPTKTFCGFPYILEANYWIGS